MSPEGGGDLPVATEKGRRCIGWPIELGQCGEPNTGGELQEW